MLRCGLMLGAGVVIGASGPSAWAQDEIIELELGGYVADSGVPGMVAAVTDEDGLLALGCSGVRSVLTGVPLEPDDPFHFGTLARPMSGVVVAGLIGDGLLSWYMPLPELLPEMDGSIHETRRDVTIEDLLHDLAGLAPFEQGDAPEFAMLESLPGSGSRSRRAFVKRLVGSDPVAEPQVQFVFSNASPSVVASVCERWSGLEWRDLLQSRVFDALGLESAGFGWPADGDDGGVFGHAQNRERFVPVAPKVFRIPEALEPGMDVRMNAADAAAYARFHLAGLRLEREDGVEVEKSVFKRLHNPIDGTYSMGWWSRGRGGTRIDQVQGDGPTFTSWVTIDPDRNCAVVVAVNAGGARELCEAVTFALLDRFAPVESGEAEKE